MASAAKSFASCNRCIARLLLRKEAPVRSCIAIANSLRLMQHAPAFATFIPLPCRSTFPSARAAICSVFCLPANQSTHFPQARFPPLWFWACCTAVKPSPSPHTHSAPGIRQRCAAPPFGCRFGPGSAPNRLSCGHRPSVLLHVQPFVSLQFYPPFSRMGLTSACSLHLSSSLLFADLT